MTSCSRSTALTYLAACRERPNLSVVAEALTTRILFEGRRAVGVELIQAGHRSVIRAREVIVSCGTFASAQLLLQSGVGCADQLAPQGIPIVLDLPGVGQNLGCHPMLSLPFDAPGACDPDPDRPRLALVCSLGERNNVMLFPRQTPSGRSMMVTLRSPQSRGELRLRSADPRVPPVIRYGYLGEVDRARLRDGIDLAIELADARPQDAITDDWLRQHLETADHASGTCKLGQPEDRLAVVDEMCRVHGLDGLRVVDLSIVPQPVRAGPYASVVMLAERAADLIMHT